MTSSFLMKSSFSQNQIFSKKQNSYVSFFLVLCLTPFAPDITFITLLFSNLRLNNFLPIVQCARQEMMTSAKGLVYFKNLCYKSYKNYIQSCFVPSLLQIEQILNKLERTFQWLPQLNLFDLKKANFCRVPVLTNLKLS